MKYLKIFTIITASLAFLTSCSKNDDDKMSYNTAPNVTVSMGQEEISFRESAGLVNVPVKITGESNGCVTVVCTVEEYGNNPAMDDVHYLVTSKTVTIAAGETEGYFELKTVDDLDINDSRYFTITISDVKGASLGSPSTTLVELKDNDRNPYDKLAGLWKIPCLDWTFNEVTLTVTLVPYDDDDLGYGHAYVLNGFGGDDTHIDVAFTFNENTELGNISIALGQTIGQYDGYDIILAGITDDNYLTNSDPLVFEWNEDFTVLTLKDHPDGFGLLAYFNGGYIYEVARHVTCLMR